MPYYLLVNNIIYKIEYKNTGLYFYITKQTQDEWSKQRIDYKNRPDSADPEYDYGNQGHFNRRDYHVH